ncbi:glycosyltransferase family 4 protein [Serratia marcescens]|uniref:glycosyltransferase family 4 protein n=1 Tax=Serratia marcescens TaxID=615 RepID=UPI0018664AAD|nr:glycosyltransferase family 4 protein [Serratia marcescens]MBN5273101.1 glycosyltransferase family 4 protein [Serratia marcescens]MBN5276115.1 glycosyltransferase family 4 protein [Serratia marcescens]MBN5306537.1 glycosyltransferase family 4 protein [Serratia marcescens]MBN5364943.1 glycosyltransferase family 4 protein [Serratia marcescens]MBN5420362.1 glycosyltransferase family 4 protein [Serratia marcescens]
MNILIVNTLYAPFKVGGAEVSVQLLAEELVSKGDRVRVVCLHNEKIRRQTELNGVEVVYLPLKNLYWPFNNKQKNKVKKILWHLIDNFNPMMNRLFEKELDDFSPDVVHTNNISGFSVAIWDSVKKKNIKLVHTTRDYYLFHHNCTLFKDGNNLDAGSATIKLTSFVKKYKSKNVDNFIGISKYISALHSDNGFAKKSAHHYIYNPIKEMFVDDVVSPIIRVGFIGRLTADKGFSAFCDKAKEMAMPGEIEFYAAGRLATSDEGNQLKSKAEKSGVHLLGFVPIESFLANIDMIYLPTMWNEPFGRVVAETASAGKHVFTSYAGGVAEIAEYFENIYKLNEFTPERLKELKNVHVKPLTVNPFDVRQLATDYKEIYEK